MKDFINSNVLVSRILYFIKLSIFANKGTDDDETLNKCVTLYNKIKKVELKDERTEEDETFIRRIIKILNLSLKVNDDGTPVCIGDKSVQSIMLQLRPLDAIISQDLGEMKRFLKHTNILLFFGIPLSFFLKKCKHIDVTWKYLLISYHLSQILIAETSDHPEAANIISMSLDALESNIVELGSLKQVTIVNKLISKDVYLKNTLLRNNLSENIHESAEAVKKILTGRGINEDSLMYKLVDKIADKMSSLDQDMSNIMSNLGPIINELGMEIRAHATENSTDDIKSQVTSIIDIFKEVTNDPENMEQVPEEAKNAINSIINSIPSNPDEKISDEKAKELKNLFNSNFSDITKKMKKADCTDPEEIRKIQRMMKSSTPEQLEKAFKFKL